LGYNFWGKSTEQVTIEEPFNTQRYGIVGHQAATNGANPALGQVVNAVEPNAKMNQLMPFAMALALQLFLEI